MNELDAHLAELRRRGRTPQLCDRDAYYTPASYYPRWERGSAAIFSRRVDTVPAYGVRGCDLVRFPRRIRLTTLEVGHRRVTDDEPWRWWTMQDIAAAIGPGKQVLVGGLGLGLMLHALKEAHVGAGGGSYVCVEEDSDVVSLVSQLVPSPPDSQIVRVGFEDYIDALENAAFDAAVLDLWPERGHFEPAEAIDLACRTSSILGGAPVYLVNRRSAEPVAGGE